MSADNEAASGMNLAERIRRLANGRHTLDVAQFQFIGMAQIRERYGARWAEKRDRVSQIARHFITRRIAPDDVLISGADGFLLVFGTFTGFLADTAAQRIAKELNTFFLGEPDLDGMQVDAQHHSMSVDDFAEVFGALISGSRELASQPARGPAPDIAMGWTPLWDARRGAVSTYFISPFDRATGRPLDWDQHSHRHADMDEKKLIASEAAMRGLFAGPGKALVGVAAHVSSFNSQQSLVRMMQAMSKFDAKLTRYRILRLSFVEPGYPRIYLEDIMRVVRPHAARIAIGLNWNEPDIASILRLQPAAIGFTLPLGALAQTGMRTEVFGRVAAAVEQARAHKVMVSVDGDISPEQALALRDAGVNFLCSPRIWPVRPALAAAEIWPSSRLEALSQAASGLTPA